MKRIAGRLNHTAYTILILLITVIMMTGGSQVFAQGRPLTDGMIMEVIEDEIENDPGVSLNDVDIEVNNGVVTMTGSVRSALAAERAARVAETVRGVRMVENRITVEPYVLRSDEQIQNDIKQALLKDPATESFEVNVTVSDNVATLGGTVQSWQEKMLAEKIAKSVKGIKNVENNIDVNYVEERADTEIQQSIESALERDVLVDDALIEVQVNDGRVKLTGTVGSASEKTQAISDAWVSGVTAVDAAGLEVEKWARDRTFREGKYAKRSEEEIREAVETALAANPRVFSFNVRPVVNDDVVILRGEVNNLKAKRAAADEAREVIGVNRVKNRLKVKNVTRMSGEKLEADIRDALARDPYVDQYEIIVEVSNSIANLYGTVDSYFEKAQADDIASRVIGVVEVDNNLTVSNTMEPFTYDPYVDDWYVYDYDWYDYQPYYTMKNDVEILEDINSEMFWSPFVDADEVNVSVEDGVATLTGEIDSWMEYSSATENAYEGGATWVNNNLELSEYD